MSLQNTIAVQLIVHPPLPGVAAGDYVSTQYHLFSTLAYLFNKTHPIQRNRP